MLRVETTPQGDKCHYQTSLRPSSNSSVSRFRQSRLLSVLEPGGGRGRARSGTFTSHSQRTSRSVSGGRRPRREELVSHHPTGRSRSSDSLSLRAESAGGEHADYRAHAFFRERSVAGGVGGWR